MIESYNLNKTKFKTNNINRSNKIQKHWNKTKAKGVTKVAAAGVESGMSLLRSFIARAELLQLLNG